MNQPPSINLGPQTLEEALAVIDGLRKSLVETTQQSDDFTYTISHDLQAPLRGIEGYGLILLEEHSSELTPAAMELVQRLLAASVRLQHLLDMLLVYSRSTRGTVERESVDVSGMVRDLLERQKLADPTRIVHTHIEPSIRVQGDSSMVRTILEQIVDNAWKFTKHVPEAHITLRQQSSPDQQDWIILIDDGSGFDPRYAHKLFQPFQRLHRSEQFEGCGMGLAIAHRLVHRHGGSIDLRCTASEGTELRFHLGQLS